MLCESKQHNSDERLSLLRINKFLMLLLFLKIKHGSQGNEKKNKRPPREAHPTKNE